MKDDQLFNKLREQIEPTLAPVQPLSPPGTRALLLPVLSFLLVGIVWAVFGLRQDYDAVGPWAVWGSGFIQILLAYSLIAYGLRSIIPGRGVPTVIGVFLASSAFIAHLAVSGWIFQLSPIYVEAGREWQLAIICIGVTLCLGLLPLAAVLALSIQGLSLRPTSLGLIFGLGSGFSAEAAWRTHCHYTAWGHILVAHTGAIIATALLGALLGFWWEKRRSRLD